MPDFRGVLVFNRFAKPLEAPMSKELEQVRVL